MGSSVGSHPIGPGGTYLEGGTVMTPQGGLRSARRGGGLKGAGAPMAEPMLGLQPRPVANTMQAPAGEGWFPGKNHPQWYQAQLRQGNNPFGQSGGKDQVMRALAGSLGGMF